MFDQLKTETEIYHRLRYMLNKELIVKSNTYSFFYNQITKLMFSETKPIEWAKFLLQVIEYYDIELTSLREKLEKYEKETTRKNID